MEQLFLMPGEERCERFKDGNGIPRVHYSYRSMLGAFFDCAAQAVAGVVDENVDLAELFNRIFNSGIDGVFFSDIQPQA